MDSTHVYLDGNNLSKLGPEMFLGRSKVSSLYLNRSKITGLSRNTFVGLYTVKLIAPTAYYNIIDIYSTAKKTFLPVEYIILFFF